MASAFLNSRQVVWDLFQKNTCSASSVRDWRMQNRNQPAKYPFEDEWRGISSF